MFIYNFKITIFLTDTQDTTLDSPEERRRRFLIEFERPFKCEKCDERFKKKKYLREHKAEIHSY